MAKALNKTVALNTTSTFPDVLQPTELRKILGTTGWELRMNMRTSIMSMRFFIREKLLTVLPKPPLRDSHFNQRYVNTLARADKGCFSFIKKIIIKKKRPHTHLISALDKKLIREKCQTISYAGPSLLLLTVNIPRIHTEKT